jgi:hypothetical protein
MPKCQKCEVVFPNRKRVNGQMMHLGSRKYCLECSPYKSHNTRRLGESADKRGQYSGFSVEVRTCTLCREVLNLTCFYQYPSGRLHGRCKSCSRQAAGDRHRKFKSECIAYKGGECVDCGKMPHPAAMAFHHLDPKQKDVEVSKMRDKRLVEEVLAELDKCVLLCLNCHAIRHVKGGDPEWGDE